MRIRIGSEVKVDGQGGTFFAVLKNVDGTYNLSGTKGGDIVASNVPKEAMKNVKDSATPEAGTGTEGDTGTSAETDVGATPVKEKRKRKEKTEEEIAEARYTPHALGRAMIELAQKFMASPPTVVVDTSAGDGRLLAKAKELYAGSGVITIAFELREVEKAGLEKFVDLVRIGDFADQTDLHEEIRASGGAHLAVQNPPFSLAEVQIVGACRLLSPDGVCVSLQRVNFLGGQERNTEWWPTMRKHLIGMWPLAERPGFAFPGGEEMTKTDSTEYALYLFSPSPEQAQKLRGEHPILGEPIFWKAD